MYLYKGIRVSCDRKLDKVMSMKKMLNKIHIEIS